MQIKTIIDNSEFASLKDKWNDLLTKSKSDNIFLTHQWIFTWWGYFGAGKELKIILVEENNELIGIAPLMLAKNNYFLKTLKFIGDPHSDYQDFILLSGNEMGIIEAIISYLHKEHFWDVIYLREIPENSETLGVLAEISGHQISKTVESVCPSFNLPTNWDEYFKTLGPKKRRNLKYYKKKLEKEYGEVLFEDLEDRNLLEKKMNMLFELHQKRWEDSEVRGIFNNSNTKDFYYDVSEQFFDKDWLHIRVLKVKDSPVSICYNFKYNKKLYHYISGRDPNWYKYSVGDLLCADTIKYAIQKGFNEFDFLRGNEGYKENWNTILSYNYSIKLINNVSSSKIKYILSMILDKCKKKSFKMKSICHKLKILLLQGGIHRNESNNG